MCLAENSQPMSSEEKYEGLTYATRTEGVRQALACSAGKVLLLSEDASLSEFSTSPRTISMIFDGDTLPLFAMPDGVSRIIASGGKKVLFAARYFADVRQIPCTLFPDSAALFGAFEQQGEVVLGGERVLAHLAEGECVCDKERMLPTLADGFSRLLLTRLAAFEAEALNAFGISCRGIEAELPETAEGIIAENARVRRAESCGGYGGEGTVLSGFLGKEACPAWSAYLLLSSLYAAFFEKGKPRRYATPDYRARAERAGVEQCSIRIPTREEYAVRALILERTRAHFVRGISSHIAKREEYCALVSRLEGKLLPIKGGNMDKLEILPEHAGSGLSAIIRDFGLMEWHHDKRSSVKSN